MKDTQFKLWRWAPVLVALSLMIVIIWISLKTVREVRQSSSAREHTVQILLDAQTLEDGLIDAEQEERGYLKTGQPKLLIEYKKETNAEMEELDHLSKLARNDPLQQARLRELAASIRAVFAQDNKVIGIYARQEHQKSIGSDEPQEHWTATENAIQDLEGFESDEKKALLKEDKTEEDDYHKAARLLVAASLVAASLLIFTNYIAGSEVARRKQGEIKQQQLILDLQKALGDVKTLSGLIPICSWCNNLRSDTGYWQNLEQYVRVHTDAKITHGLCPTCAEKWEQESSKPA